MVRVVYTIDVDAIPCIQDLDPLLKQIETVAKPGTEARLRSVTRKVFVFTDGVELKPCCPVHPSRFITNWRFGNRFRRKVVINGLVLQFFEKANTATLAEWRIAKSLIIHAKVIMSSKGELANPATKPALRCELTILHPGHPKQEVVTGRIIATIGEGGFYRAGGELVDASNAGEVLASLRGKIAD